MEDLFRYLGFKVISTQPIDAYLFCAKSKKLGYICKDRLGEVYFTNMCSKDALYEDLDELLEYIREYWKDKPMFTFPKSQ